MRLPLKVNQARWGWLFRNSRRLTYPDPRLIITTGKGLSAEQSAAVISAFKFSKTTKVTRPHRHPESNRFLATVYKDRRPVILDVGASDGGTSLDLMLALGGAFSSFFVTDLNLQVTYGTNRDVTYFLDSQGKCIFGVSRNLVVFGDLENAVFPTRLLAQMLLSRRNRVRQWSTQFLVRPELVELSNSDPRVGIIQYNMFEPWKNERPHL